MDCIKTTYFIYRLDTDMIRPSLLYKLKNEKFNPLQPTCIFCMPLFGRHFLEYLLATAIAT